MKPSPSSSVNSDAPRPTGTASSVAEVAKALGADPRSVFRWLAAGAPKPKKKGGPYDLGAIWDWVRTNIDPKKVTASVSTGAPLTDARLRKMDAEIRLLELEEKEKLRQLVPIEEAHEVIRMALMPFRDSLVGMPDSLASRCNPADPDHARLALEAWRNQIMKQMQRALEKTEPAPVQEVAA